MKKGGIKKLFKKQKKNLILFLFLILMIPVFFIFCNLFTKANEINDISRDLSVITKKDNQEEIKIPRRIDGVFVSSEKEANSYPIAVIIDNMIEARPPVGLSKANLVIEALTEANITRFLAIFASNQEIKKIGPVRSARPYFVEWAEEFKALYAHSGGSPEALENIKNRQYDVYDLNEFSFGRYFWRDPLRSGPHDLFTSRENLEDALGMKKIADNEPTYVSWLFKNDESIRKRENKNQEIKIVYKDPDYLVNWKYNFFKNNYLRYQTGKKHLDEDGSEIRAKNIVIQKVQMQILDEVGRKKIQTIGEGSAVIFQDGKIIEGKWSKSAKGERTMFFDKDGSEIKFNRGTTWIEVVPIGYKVEY